MRAEWLGLMLGLSLALPAVAGEALPADLLEFLGTASQEGGQWLDPMSLHDSPEIFARAIPAGQDGKPGHDTTRAPDVSPSKDTSPPKNGDGGNKHD